MSVTYLAAPLARDALRIWLGDAATIMPLPSDEASCEFLRGETLVLVPLSDKDRSVRSTAALLRLAGIPCSISPVSAEWVLATGIASPVTPDKAYFEKLLQGIALHPTDKQPHLDEAATSCEWMAGYQRVEFPMVLENLLPAGIVGGINAEGGTGKTYILITLFAAIAAGVAWGPFRPVRPHKVLLLLAEDPTDVVRNRAFDIASQIIPMSHRSLLLGNFHCASVRGLSGPLMGMTDGNPTPTPWLDWLHATIEAHPGTEVLGLDPLRKFYGLDENKNEFAHAFIGLLEALTLRHGLTALYAHHVSKANRAAEVGQITGRGAGGLSDNCRWMAAMRTVDPVLHENLELEGAPHEYVEFAVTKNNYAPMLPAPAYFRRGEHGVLSPLPAARNKLDTQAEYLADLIGGQEYSFRDVAKSVVGKDVREAMKERFPGWKKDDFAKVIQHALGHGYLEEIEQDVDGKSRARKVLDRCGRQPV